MFKNNSIYLLIGLVLINFVQCYIYPHSYVLYTSQVTQSQAITACASSTYNGMNGYLATVSNSIEYNSVKAAAGNNSFWISGTQVSTGVWQFNSGPESSQPLYNTFTETCTNFCDWGSDTPTLSSSDIFIFYDSSKSYWNNGESSKLLSYVCEYSNDEFFLPQAPPSKSSFDITPVSYISTAIFQAVFTNVASNQVITSCSFWQYFPTCTLSAMEPGIYNVSYQPAIISGFQFTAYYTYQLNSPTVTSLYPSGFTSGSMISVAGSNFGSVVSSISITFSSSAVPCTPKSFISGQNSNETIIICKLTGDLNSANRIYPIFVKINGVISKFYRVPIYYKDGKYVSTSNIPLLNSDISTFPSNFSIYGKAATTDYVDSIEYQNYLSFISNYQVWIGATYDSTNFLSSIDNSVISIYTTTTDFSSLFTNQLLSYDIPTSLLLDNNGVDTYGSLMSYQFPSGASYIQFTSFGVTTSMTTAGGAITFSMVDVGTIYDPVTILLNGTSLNTTVSRDFTNKKITITFPETYPGTLYEVRVTIGSYTTLENSQYVQVGTPSNIAVSSPPLTSGGRCTISGTNLFNNVSLLSVFTPSYTCTSIQWVQKHVSFSCVVPAGYVSSTASFTFAGVYPASFTLSYGSAVISKYSTVGTMGGLVTISGSNFYNDSLILGLTFTSLTGSCTNIAMIVPHTQFSCIVPTGDYKSAGYAPKIKLSGTDVTSGSAKKLVFQKQQVLSASNTPVFNHSGVVDINGAYFSNRTLSISIGGLSCPTPTYVSQSLVTCNFSGTVVPVDDSTPLNVVVTCSTLSITGGIFFYATPPPPCPNNCTGNGDCISGQCNCAEGYGSADCSQQLNGTTPTPTGDGSGQSILYADSFEFTTNLAYIREVSINGTTEKLFKVSDFIWVDQTNSTDSNNTFNQYLEGNYDNDTVVLEIDYYIYQEENIINFAGDTFIVPKNSIKYNIKISNWTFSSTLNYLEVVYQSNSPKQLDNKKTCATTTIQSQLNTPTSNLTYQIQLGNSILEGKFARRFYLDDRITESTIKLLPEDDSLTTQVRQDNQNSLIVLASFVIPYFNESANFDPSFQSLITATPDDQSSGSDDSCDTQAKADSSKWKLIVTIVVPCVAGVAIVFTLSVYLYKKRFETRSMKKIKALTSKNANN